MAQDRNTTQAELERLKAQLLRPVLEKTSQPELCHQLYLAANEAVAEAWGKPFPFVTLSCLWEDKVRQVRCWFQRQQEILLRTQPLQRAAIQPGAGGTARASSGENYLQPNLS